MLLRYGLIHKGLGWGSEKFYRLFDFQEEKRKKKAKKEKEKKEIL